MKSLVHQAIGQFALGLSIMTASMVLPLRVESAQTIAYMATGSVNQVLAPGILCPNGLGQMLMRGNVFTVRVDSTDLRLTGKRTVFTDGYVQTDGSTVIYGAAYHEVGSWAGTNWTPGGGMWELQWRGVMQTNYSMQLSQSGYGSGGAIDGMRLEETVTRTNASAPIDLMVPFLYTGTVKPPPLSTNLLVESFDSPAAGWTLSGPGTHTYTRTNGQLIVRGYWPGVITRTAYDAWTYGYPGSSWTVSNGQTAEARVDLVDLSAGPNAAIFIMGNNAAFYAIHRGHDFMWVFKWTSRLTTSVITLFYEKVQVPSANVVLALALTRADPNLVVTARMLDKAGPANVLYEHSWVDTPGVDTVLTSEEFLTLSGMNVPVSPDLPGALVTNGMAAIGVYQDNYDGKQPAAIATFDNLVLKVSDLPPLGIRQAVWVSWPVSSAFPSTLESGSSVQGPWQPVPDLSMPGMMRVSIPASEVNQFFRLR